MTVSPRTQICMVIGDPISQSLSPLMHNAAFEELGCADEFVFLARKVPVEALCDAINGVRALGIKGVSCTMPHKERVIEYLDELDPHAKSIGAVNTIVNNDGTLKGYNTDIDGIVEPLKAVTELSDKSTLIIGAGGAARSAAFGLTDRCQAVTILNRTEKRGKELADSVGARYISTIEKDELSTFDIIINTTPVGMSPHTTNSPLPDGEFNSNQIVMDAIYNPPLTRLLSNAHSAGATIVTGIDMFVRQGAKQFELYTDQKAPVKIMEGVVRSMLEMNDE